VRIVATPATGTRRQQRLSPQKSAACDETDLKQSKYFNEKIDVLKYTLGESNAGQEQQNLAAKHFDY
jgi:hypothetical protein